MELREPAYRNRRIEWEEISSQIWMLKSLRVQILLYSLPLLRGIVRPYVIYYPNIGEVSFWWLITVVGIGFPLFATVILLAIARSFQKDLLLSSQGIRRGIGAILFVFALSVSYVALQLFLLWYRNPVGQYFLWPHSSYYLVKVWEFARPYLLFIETGIVVGLFFFILYLFTHGRVMEKNEAFLGILLGIIHGPERIVLVLLLAFLLTVVWHGIKRIRKTPSPMLRVTPWLVVASYLVLVLIW